LRRDFLPLIHFDDDFVAEPITEKIHCRSDDKGNYCSLLAAENATYPDQ
jgi:hypothetical protein